jgi:hypothetical protein
MSKPLSIEPNTAQLPEDHTARRPPSWRHARQLDLDAAIIAADRGEFASADEVRDFFARHIPTT